MMTITDSFLLHGHDTVECAYYLQPGHDCQIDFAWLSYEKEALRQSKNRDPKVIALGGREFLLKPYGSNSGYSFIIEDAEFFISFSEFMSPSFFVKFKCQALWQHGLLKLHQAFLAWTKAVGLQLHREESLSRVDFSFDYQLSPVDFDEEHFVSLSSKDSCHRKDGVNQTFQFGKSDIVLRVYDKIAEIEEQSHKDWFYTLWETDENVWRIEWQCRKPALKRFGLHTIDELLAGQGDILRYLASEHDTLRSPNRDSNRSRWPLHPLWADLQAQIETLPCLGVYREIDEKSRLAEKEWRIAQSIYGYLKQEAALNCVRRDIDSLSALEAFGIVRQHIEQFHDPFTWKADVEKKIQHLRLGS